MLALECAFSFFEFSFWINKSVFLCFDSRCRSYFKYLIFSSLLLNEGCRCSHCCYMSCSCWGVLFLFHQRVAKRSTDCHQVVRLVTTATDSKPPTDGDGPTQGDRAKKEKILKMSKIEAATSSYESTMHFFMDFRN